MGLLKRLNISRRSSHAPQTQPSTESDRKKSVVSLVPLSEVTEESLKVWRALPGKIRQDPSMISFQQVNDNWRGENDNADAPHTSANNDDIMPYYNQFSIDEKDDSDSDNGEFITIKVTNEDGELKEKEIEHIKEYKPRDDSKEHHHHVTQHILHQESPPKDDDHHDKDSVQNPFHKFGKMGFLVFVWIVMVAFLASTPEKKIEKKQLSIPIEEKRYFDFESLLSGPRVNVTFEGAFLAKDDPNIEGHTLTVYLQTISFKILTPYKIFQIARPNRFDFANSTKIDLIFDVGEDNLDELKEREERVQMVMVTHFVNVSERDKQEMPLIMTYDLYPLNKQIGVIFGIGVLVFLYALIIWDVVHRTFAAMMASTMAIAILAALNDRPTHDEIIAWIDVETVLLLFSMMIIVAVLTETGIFDHLAVYAYKVTNGKIWPLIHCLCIITTLISMLLDNVTTVLLMAPITITLCEEMDLNPVPILMAIVVHANIGGTTTPVGDPPNIIITSNPTILENGISFATFSTHMGVGVIILMITTALHLRFNYKDINSLFFHEPKEIKNLRKNIIVWERASQSISPMSKDANMVRETLIKKVKVLRHDLKKKLAKGIVPTTRYKATLEDMQKAYPIKKKQLLIKSGIVLAFILVLFFVESIPEIHRLSLGWSALLGVILLLIISNRDDMDAMMHRVEWPTLLFFAAMFVLMEAVERMGLIAWIGHGTEEIIRSVSKEYRLSVAIIIIMWVSAITSAFVDSIPVTQMMVKIVVSLAANKTLGLPLQPLVWALAFGPCLGGNGTLVGASANVICAGIAEQHGYKLTFMDFFKFGMPQMIASVVITTGYLLVAHVLFAWH